MAQSNQDIQIYSISPNTPLSEIVPLSDAKNNDIFVLNEKPHNFTCDIVIHKEKRESFGKRFRKNLKILGGIYKNNNIFYNLFSDLLCIFKAIGRSYKN